MKIYDFIDEQTKRMQEFVESSKFKDDDIRKGFFLLQNDVIQNFKRGITILLLNEQINKRNVLFAEATEKLEPQLQHLIQTDTVKYFPSFRNNLYRSLIIDGYSIFEFCLTVFCNHYLTEKEKIDLIHWKYYEVEKELKKSSTDIGFATYERIRTSLTENHLSHVPLLRKFRKLTEKVRKKYERDRKQDVEFITFIGKFRNSMHANYIYYGKDYDYNFKGIDFRFRNGKVIKYNGKPSSIEHLNLVIELIDIYREIASKIQHIGIIPYPDSDAP